jgi:membrane-bound lytic murein transglycosylase B
VYVAGGAAGLTGSVLGASSPDDVLWRVSTADRVLSGLLARTSDRVVNESRQAEAARQRAVAADAATDAQAQALQKLQRQAQVAAGVLDQARATLSNLDDRARMAKAAQEALRQIIAAQAAAEAARRSAMGRVTALGIPAEYQQAYRAAALTCPGMSWTLLAGVGQVESGHGRNNGPSSAGAIGPMQFMPRTFGAYAVDGDHDGAIDAWDPQDAIFTAAHYLCVSGDASGATANSAAWKQTALLAYNHAQWYVDLVLAAEQAIITRAAADALP